MNRLKGCAPDWSYFDDYFYLVRSAMGNYEIRNLNDPTTGTQVLEHFFGSFWESILDRLPHGYDGYLLTIHQHGQALKVYRRVRAPGGAVA